jgi:hypothetical protein
MRYVTRRAERVQNRVEIKKKKGKRKKRERKNESKKEKIKRGRQKTDKRSCCVTIWFVSVQEL